MGHRFAIADVNKAAGTRLEIGCGEARAKPGFVTMDVRDLPSVDIVGDATKLVRDIESDKITAIYTSHFLEHIPDPHDFISELVRISVDGATWEIIVPHFSNPWYYSDVTHKTPFGLYSFCYLGEDRVPFRRTVPDYARVPGLTLTAVDLVFGSLPGWPVRRFSRKLFEKLVNASTWSKEFYEDALTGLVPCYQLNFHLTVDKSNLPSS